MRDKLSNMIQSAVNGCAKYWADVIADKLIAEGVIVPICKVGSDVYCVDHENKSVWGGNVCSFSLDAAHLWFNCHYKCGLNIWHPIEDFGKTVFLTRSEAEIKLKENSNACNN